MPLLVFGGPYSNLQATQAMMAEAHRRGIPPKRIICTGDVVAYCGHPEETIAAIRDWGIHVIQGNCEEQLAVAAADCGCGFDEGSACDMLAKNWYAFANARLSAESRRWMAALPRTLEFDIAGVRAKVVHGGVRQINRFLFASQTAELQGELKSAGTDLVIGGHCGIPFIRQIEGGAWFNPGVIGMPANDGTPRGWHGLIEPAEVGGPGRNLNVSVHPLDYDHAAAAAAVRAGGYANAYAEALMTGLWPSLDVLPAIERAATGSRFDRLAEILVFPKNGTDAGAQSPDHRAG
jgi:predicted phosphodiesterase